MCAVGDGGRGRARARMHCQKERRDLCTNCRAALYKLQKRSKSHGMIDVDNVNCMSSNVQSSHREALLYVFEDNEAVIQMIIKGRSHRVALDCSLSTQTGLTLMTMIWTLTPPLFAG